MYSITEIAKALNLRSKRVLNKVQALEIPVQYNEDLVYIDIEGLHTLTVQYTKSKRTSERTRQLANTLLTQIDVGDVNLSRIISISKSQNMEPESPQSPLRPTSSDSNNASPNLQAIVDVLAKSLQTVLAASIQSLESMYFKFFALFVAIFVQMHHTAVWFYRTAPEGTASWPAAIGFAIMLDLFILVVTMEGRISIAKSFATLTFISNMLYFQFWISFEGNSLWYTRAISSTMISGIIAFVLYSYTEIFIKYKNVQHPS